MSTHLYTKAYQEPKRTQVQRGEFLVDRYEGSLTPGVAVRIHQSLCAYFQENRQAFQRDCLWSECDRDRAQVLCHMLSLLLLRADVLIWEPAIGNAAGQGADAFLGHTITPEENVPEAQLWLFGIGDNNSERNRMAKDLFELPAASQTLGALLIPELGGSVEREPGGGAFMAMNGEGGLCAALLFLNQDLSSSDYAAYYLRPLPAMFVGHPIMDPVNAKLFAMRKFLQLPFVERRELPLPRPERRRLQKAGVSAPEVRTVILRKAKPAPASDETAATVEWSCSWLVSGHWRRLHQPRKEDGAETTYVHPYVKGPEDKPLKIPTKTVFKVSR